MMTGQTLRLIVTTAQHTQITTVMERRRKRDSPTVDVQKRNQKRKKLIGRKRSKKLKQRKERKKFLNMSKSERKNPVKINKAFIYNFPDKLVMADIDAVVLRLQKLGLAESKAKETVKNKSLTSNLTQLMDWAGEGVDLTGVRGNLLYHVASKCKPQMWSLVPVLVRLVCEDKLDNELRLNAAIDFLLKTPPGTSVDTLDLAKLEEVAGVGVVITPEQVEEAVEKALEAVRSDILAQRWR